MNRLRISLALLFAFATSIISFAHDFEVDGIYYNNNSDGTSVSVTYKGSSYDEYYNEYTGNVEIPNQVAYGGIIYSVTSIGNNAFCWCYGLTSIIIPNSVTSIGSSAFDYCSGLTSVTIPNSVTSIGERAFSGCSGLTKIVVLEGNSTFDSRNDCNAIIETSTNTLIVGCKITTIPNSVTSIGDDAFRSCSGLTSVTIPNSVTSIGYGAFNGCSGLTSVTIGNSVTSIGDYAFYYCKGLTKIVVLEGNSTFDSRNDCNAIIETSTNTLIVGCKNTTIPNSVTSIGGSAFYGCSGLTSVTIPNSITSIGDHAFSGCTGLTSVTIPNSVTTIGDYAFAGCSGLTSVIFNAENCNSLSSSWLSDSPITSFTIGENVKTIPANLCYGLSKLTSITIPNSVTSIGDGAFEYCSGLTYVTIPNSVTSIGHYAFWDCSGLTSVTIPNSVTSIGYSAFEDCRGLTSVIYNAENCNSLGLSWLSDSPITSFTIGENVRTIPAYLCYGLSKLTSITIPNSVTSIGYGAFNGCSGLTSVTIGNSVTSIDDWAFSGCSGLTKVEISDIAAWCKISFSGASSNPLYYAKHLYLNGNEVKNLVIPNSVTSIGSFAFYKCPGLTSVTIGNSVTSIGDYAFCNCSRLTSIQCDAVIPPSLGYSVFDNVDKSVCTLIVPDGSLEAYKAANQWKDFLNIGGVEEIAIEESNISIENGKIINSNNENIEVYNLSGVKVYSGNKAEVELNSGVYIVVIGNKAVKIAL